MILCFGCGLYSVEGHNYIGHNYILCFGCGLYSVEGTVRDYELAANYMHKAALSG